MGNNQQSDLFLVESAAWSSGSNALDGEPSGKLRSSPTAPASSGDTGPTPPTSAMLAGWTGPEFLPLTLFVEGSPASPLASPESEKGRRIAAGFGPNSPDAFATYDPDLRCWKTSPDSSGSDLVTSSAIWPRSGSMRNGAAYLRPPWERRTSDGGFSSSPGIVHEETFPTPTATQFGGSDPETFEGRREREKAKGRNGNGFGLTLEQAVLQRMYPTPTATDGNRGDYTQDGKTGQRRPSLQGAARTYPTPMAADSERSSETYGRGNRTLLGEARHRKLWPTAKASDADRGGLADRYLPGSRRSNLVDALKMYPTPLAGDATRGPDYARAARNGKGESLATVVARENWATPTARDYRSGTGTKLRLGHAPQLAEQIGGQLNPPWVEWLMGFPIGWTALEPSGIQLCLLWDIESDAGS